MSKKLKVGIIGIGNMGGGHAKNRLCKEGVCPDMELVAVFTRRAPETVNGQKMSFPKQLQDLLLPRSFLTAVFVRALSSQLLTTSTPPMLSSASSAEFTLWLKSPQVFT